MRRRTVWQALAAGAAGPTLAAAVGSPLRPARAATSDDDVVVVAIRDFKYLPAHVVVRVGARVRWVNQERRTPHTVRLAGPAWPNGLESELLFPGDSFEHRFDQPGVVSYLCGPHPEMTGTVEIRR